MEENFDKKSEAPEKSVGKDGDSFFWEVLKFFFLTLLIVIPVRFWVAQPFIVSGASMLPTLLDGEYLIIDEISPRFQDYERGEIVVFRYPNDPSKFFIKRIIGLPGDMISIKDGKVFLYNEEHKDGVLLQEPYIDGIITGPEESITLGKDEYFVLGDNRNVSFDSRVFGALEKDFVVGRVLVRLWPFTKIEFNPGEYIFSGLK